MLQSRNAGSSRKVIEAYICADQWLTGGAVEVAGCLVLVEGKTTPWEPSSWMARSTAEGEQVAKLIDAMSPTVEVAGKEAEAEWLTWLADVASPGAPLTLPDGPPC